MRTAAIVLVGYTLQARLDAEQLMPEFEAPSNYGAEKAAEYVSKQRAAWLAGGCAESPYTGTLASCTLACFPPVHGDVLDPKIMECPDTDELSGLLKDCYGGLFDRNGEYKLDGVVRFIGFEPRRFLKILGLEAAEKGNPLPQDLWYGGSEYRDIEAMVCPEKSGTSLAQAIRRLLGEQASDFAGFRSGVKASQDVRLMALLLKRLALYPHWHTALERVIKALGATGAVVAPPPPAQFNPVSAAVGKTKVAPPKPVATPAPRVVKAKV